MQAHSSARDYLMVPAPPEAYSSTAELPWLPSRKRIRHKRKDLVWDSQFSLLEPYIYPTPAPCSLGCGSFVGRYEAEICGPSSIVWNAASRDLKKIS